MGSKPSRAANCTSIARISLRRSSANHISPSGKSLRGNIISIKFVTSCQHLFQNVKVTSINENSFKNMRSAQKQRKVKVQYICDSSGLTVYFQYYTVIVRTIQLHLYTSNCILTFLFGCSYSKRKDLPPMEKMSKLLSSIVSFIRFPLTFVSCSLRFSK